MSADTMLATADPAFVTFHEDDHSYWLGLARIPSVSEILQPLNTSWLSTIPEAILNRKRDIGLAVHRACELIDTGYEIDPETLDDDVAGYVDGYRKFLIDTKPTWQSVERMVFDPARWYAGRLDRTGIVSGKPYVIDIKTSASVQPSVAVQLTAYAEADQDAHSEIAALQLLPKGDYRFVTVERQPDVWAALLTLHKFQGEVK